MEVDEVLRAAQAAKDAGATRFCMGAAWRAPKDRDVEKVAVLVEAVKGLGLQTCATLGMLGAAARAAAQGCRARLLQPQPRHGARVLHRHRRHAHLPGPARHAGPCAQRRHQRVLRRHRRHGRGAGAPGGPDRAAGQPGSVPGIGADQQPGARARHAAGRLRRPVDPLRLRAHDRRRAHHDADGARAAVGGPPATGRRGAGAVLHGRAPIRSSTATSCWSPATPTSRPTCSCCASWA